MLMRLLGRPGALILAAVLLYACPPKKPGEKNPCKNPDFVAAMTAQAMAFYNMGNYIEALKSAHQAEECKPDDPELYYVIGLIYFKRDKTYESIDAFRKSLDIDPSYTRSMMALGAVYLSLQRYDEAVEQFERAADDDFFERPWEAYNNLGWTYMQKGNLAMAEVNLERALKQNPNYCPAYTNLGELHARKDRTREAIQSYRKAISLCPGSYARPHFLLGIEYGKVGVYDKACRELAAAASINNSEEAEKAVEYMRIYDCPGVLYTVP